jgi:carboxylate-amine ligase
MAPFEEASVALPDLARLQEDACARVEQAGLLRRAPFPLDVVPRVLPAAEWEPIEAGLGQRVMALNAFVADAYGERRIVQAGVVPARVIETAAHYEPGMRGVELDVWVGIAGLDLVREPSGEFLVLEDNLMTPSGFGFAAAAREAVAASFEERPRDYSELPQLLAGVLGDGYVVVLGDGPDHGAHWELNWVAEQLGIPLVRPSELHRRGDHVVHGGRRVDGVYRRTDADLLRTEVGALLAPAIRAGTIRVVNAFGTGVGDDKLTHAYVEDMIRFYLGQDPLMRSVRTFDLARRDHLEEALDRFEELVIKPRAGHGGIGVVVCPRAEPEEVEETRERVRADPRQWVAQPLVELSTHATLIDGELAQRHVDLRPFAFLHGPDRPRVLPGGLTRYARGEGQVVVNSIQNGGFKDTWVLDR